MRRSRLNQRPETCKTCGKKMILRSKDKHETFNVEKTSCEDQCYIRYDFIDKLVAK